MSCLELCPWGRAAQAWQMRFKGGPRRSKDVGAGFSLALTYSLPSPPTLRASQLIPPEAKKENQRLSLVCILHSFLVIYHHFFVALNLLSSVSQQGHCEMLSACDRLYIPRWRKALSSRNGNPEYTITPPAASLGGFVLCGCNATKPTRENQGIWQVS